MTRPNFKLSRALVRRKAKQRKIQNQNNVFHRKISKKKYYGTGVLIDKYEELIRNGIPLLSERATENLGRDLTQEFFQNVVFEIETAENILEESIKKGANRVFNLQGEKLSPAPLPVNFAFQSLLEEQQQLFSGVTRRITEKIRERVAKGLSKGESNAEITRGVNKMIRSRRRYEAERIARSEVIKASNEGIEATFDHLGVRRVVWLATLDDRVCETCRDLHMSGWKRGRNPKPVVDTHPNCRCTLVVDTENL